MSKYLVGSKLFITFAAENESIMSEQWRWQEPGEAWKGMGIYHVTLTIPSREQLLGTLEISNLDPRLATIKRTDLGEKLIHILFKTTDFHPQIQILQFCLMPDHLHAVWFVRSHMPRGIMTAVRGFWQGAKKIGREYALSISPNTIRDNERSLSPLFTQMPFVRPMSRRGQLQAMIRYVQMNPQRLATKRLMPGYFRVQEDIEIAGRSYAGVGNTALLLSEHFKPVHVRHSMVEAAVHGEPQALRDYMNGCVLAARKGSVMVSPFISPKEKEVLTVLLREGHPFIYLEDNGFRDYYKPQDALFDACAAGHVLILSPWSYDAGKRHISRADCVALNNMAEEICSLSY